MRLEKIMFGAMLAILTALSPAAPVTGDTKPLIAVIPISDNSPPSLHISKSAVSQVERALNRLDYHTLIDSTAVAAAARQLNLNSGSENLNWRSLASTLNLDQVALLSVEEAHVEYLGEQFDHLAVGEPNTKPGTVHLFEGVVTLRLVIKVVEPETTLMAEEVTGKKAEGFRQSYDAAKYAEIVSAIRDLAAIFNEDIEPGGMEQRADDHASLAYEALNKASKKLERPLRKVF